MGKTKNQHYVSRSILQHFANTKDQVHECLVQDKKIYMSNINNSMSGNLIYEHTSLETNTIENTFSKIEAKVMPKIKMIIDCLTNDMSEKHKLDTIKKIVEEILLELLIFYYRSGALLNEYQFANKDRDQTILNLLEHIHNSSYLKALKRTIIDYYDFAIIKSENNNFILSDQYISTASLNMNFFFLNLNNRQMGLKDVIILIPLTSQYYISFFNGNKPPYINKNKINLLDDREVDLINKVIINNSYNKCIAQSKKSIENVIDQFTIKSPYGFIGLYSGGRVNNRILKKHVFFYEEDQKAYDLCSSANNKNYKNTTRNELCLCGSGIKFKNCCLNIYQKVDRAIYNINYNRDNTNLYTVHPKAILEKAIDQFDYFQ
ncbi:hypothetical protein COM55_00450 [Bacillus pseudomycoides]|uniref:DUF4238 domain-containing protein n=1 Tax=Bacillus pseudomycoides TaxID=64104 RepID=UPI000BFA39A1|nr:DUF4238 domain-containing protein [Bacillus pseudomycoides]PGE89038.1 hypothetical protein COM55_00450 [Bacillus pseudomycoides]